MGAWDIKCYDCGKGTYPQNIDDLMRTHVDEEGWFKCEHCSGRGYIEKRYKNMDDGYFEPCLQGAIQPENWNPQEVYQPFAFFASDSPEERPSNIWFCYYKKKGGRVKYGSGPGGTPILQIEDARSLIEQVDRIGELK